MLLPNSTADARIIRAVDTAGVRLLGAAEGGDVGIDRMAKRDVTGG
jgi:hypothetical protein